MRFAWFFFLVFYVVFNKYVIYSNSWKKNFLVFLFEFCFVYFDFSDFTPCIYWYLRICVLVKIDNFDNFSYKILFTFCFVYFGFLISFINDLQFELWIPNAFPLDITCVWNETRIYENFRSYVVCFNHNLTFKEMFGAISHLFNLTFGNRILKLSKLFQYHWCCWRSWCVIDQKWVFYGIYKDWPLVVDVETIWYIWYVYPNT